MLHFPEKRPDPGKFSVTVGFGQYKYESLCDLGASVSIMPLSIWRKVKIGCIEPVDAKLYMANNTVVIPTGMVDNVPVQVGKFYIPADFLVIDMAEDPACHIILGRPFLATADSKFRVRKRLIAFTIGN